MPPKVAGKAHEVRLWETHHPAALRDYLPVNAVHASWNEAVILTGDRQKRAIERLPSVPNRLNRRYRLGDRTSRKVWHRAGGAGDAI